MSWGEKSHCFKSPLNKKMFVFKMFLPAGKKNVFLKGKQSSFGYKKKSAV